MLKANHAKQARARHLTFADISLALRWSRPTVLQMTGLPTLQSLLLVSLSDESNRASMTVNCLFVTLVCNTYIVVIDNCYEQLRWMV
jgi:4-hydroxybenzoate polyprenyltransferase